MVDDWASGHPRGISKYVHITYTRGDVDRFHEFESYARVL